MWSHSVTCHPTQVNTPHLNPSETGRYSIYLPWRNGRLGWPRWLVTYRDGLPARRRSPMQVLTQQCTARSWTHNLLIMSVMWCMAGTLTTLYSAARRCPAGVHLVQVLHCVSIFVCCYVMLWVVSTSCVCVCVCGLLGQYVSMCVVCCCRPACRHCSDYIMYVMSSEYICVDCYVCGLLL